MTARNVRMLVFGMFAAAGAGILGMTSTLNSALALADPVDTTLVFGGSGLPIPPPDFVTDVMNKFVTPANGFPLSGAQSAYTPEGFAPTDPLTGVKSLAPGPSEAQGLDIMNQDILAQTQAGHDVTVFGYSQSAGIATQEAINLANQTSGAPDPSQLQFVLIGDTAGPFLGPQTDVPYNFDIYSLQYDGVTQPPEYPINFLADINAALGFLYVHSSYAALTPAELDPSNITQYTFTDAAGGDITYNLIHTADLPLLDPIRSIPVFGKPIADLLQPDLQVLVNLGYGGDNLGYTPPSLDVSPGLQLFPSVNPATLLGELATGAQQGVGQFASDLPQVPSELVSFLEQFPSQVINGLEHINQLSYITILSDLLGPGAAQVLEGEYAPIAAVAPLIPVPTGPLAPLVDAVNTLSGTLAFDYATLLPTADNLVTIAKLPIFDAGLFASELSQGNLLDAIGLPIAADTGALVQLAASEIDVIGLAGLHTIGDLASLLP